jgi:SAM-dependent methyltransferase
MNNNVQQCGDEHPLAGRDCVVGAYAFFRRYVLMPWESCLDVGGGSGAGAGLLRQRSKRVKSIDQDLRLIKFGVELGSVEDFDTNAFDWCVAIDVVEHVEDDLRFIRELWRVAKKGVFLTTPNLDEHPGRIWPYHIREYSVKEFGGLFNAAELNETSRYHFGCDPYGGRMSRRNLSSSFEHQAILALKSPCVISRSLIGFRELLL